MTTNIPEEIKVGSEFIDLDPKDATRLTNEMSEIMHSSNDYHKFAMQALNNELDGSEVLFDIMAKRRTEMKNRDLDAEKAAEERAMKLREERLAREPSNNWTQYDYETMDIHTIYDEIGKRVPDNKGLHEDDIRKLGEAALEKRKNRIEENNYDDASYDIHDTLRERNIEFIAKNVFNDCMMEIKQLDIIE